MEITKYITVSELLALIPGGHDWKIVNSQYALRRGPQAQVALYLDDQVPGDEGWAYRLTVWQSEPGAFGVRHPHTEESGQVNSEADLAAVLDWV